MYRVYRGHIKALFYQFTQVIDIQVAIFIVEIRAVDTYRDNQTI